MADAIPGHPLQELEGLADHFIQATTGVIARPVRVLHLGYDGDYGRVVEDTYPLILFPTFKWRLTRMTQGGGGGKGRKGQNPGRPNVYDFEIHDLIDPRAPRGTLVASAQTDMLLLIQAIAAWFDWAPNRCLPDAAGTPRASIAGEDIQFAGGVYKNEDTQEIRVVGIGKIDISGVIHPGDAP